MKSRIPMLLLLGIVGIGSIVPAGVHGMVSSVRTEAAVPGATTSAITGQDTVKATMLAHAQKPAPVQKPVAHAQQATGQRAPQQQPIDSKDQNKSLVAKIKGYFEPSAANAFKKVDKKYVDFEKKHELSQKECALFESQLIAHVKQEEALFKSIEDLGKVDTALFKSDAKAQALWGSNVEKKLDEYTQMARTRQNVCNKMIVVYTKQMDVDGYVIDWLKHFADFAQSEDKKDAFALAKTKEGHRRLKKALGISETIELRSRLVAALMEKVELRGNQVSGLLLTKFRDVFGVESQQFVALNKRIAQEMSKTHAKAKTEILLRKSKQYKWLMLGGALGAACLTKVCSNTIARMILAISAVGLFTGYTVASVE